MAKIDGFSVVKAGKTVRMSRLQCDECGREWVCAEVSMKKLEDIYTGKHVCNTCIADKDRTAAKWKKAV